MEISAALWVLTLGNDFAFYFSLRMYSRITCILRRVSNSPPTLIIFGTQMAKWCIHFPPHLIFVSALLCETLMPHIVA